MDVHQLTQTYFPVSRILFYQTTPLIYIVQNQSDYEFVKYFIHLVLLFAPNDNEKLSEIYPESSLHRKRVWTYEILMLYNLKLSECHSVSFL